MPSSYTALGFVKQATGENESTWGDFLNNGGLELIDQAIRGRVAFSLSGAKTLTSINGTESEARKAILHITGGTGGTVTIPNYSKAYFVINEATGNVIITAGGVKLATVRAGDTTVVVSDGSDVRNLQIGGLDLKQYVDAQAFAQTNLPGINPGTDGQILSNDGEIGLWVDHYPGQSGKAGKGLRSTGALGAEVWDWAGLSGSASLSIAVDTVLAGDSPPVQRVTPTVACVSILLPDCTALANSARERAISNAGNFALGVRDSAGTLLSVIPPKAGALFVASDIGSAAGVWDVQNTRELGVLVWPSASLIAEAVTGLDVQALTTDKAIVVWSRANAVRAAVLTRSGATLSLGTPVTVATPPVALGPKAAALGATSAAMVWMEDGGDNIKAAALSISGSTVTTGATVSVASGAQYNPEVSALALDPTRAAISYSGGGNASVAVVGVSGTTATVGAPVSLTGTATAGAALAALGSGAFLAADNSTLTACSTSTTTVTAGTPFACTFSGGGGLLASSSGHALLVGNNTGYGNVEMAAIVAATGSTIGGVSRARAINGVKVSGTGLRICDFGSALLLLGSICAAKIGRVVGDQFTVSADVQIDHDFPVSSGVTPNPTVAPINGSVGAMIVGTPTNIYGAVIEVIK